MRKKISENGQSSILFALLIPLFVIGMVFAVDFGRFLVLQNQAQIYADGAATAAASALDVSKFTENRTNVLNEAWANSRAKDILEVKDIDIDGTFILSGVQVKGNQVTVTVSASCATMWSKPFGVGAYNTTATSSARAATGIVKEMP